MILAPRNNLFMFILSRDVYNIVKLLSSRAITSITKIKSLIHRDSNGKDAIA